MFLWVNSYHKMVNKWLMIEKFRPCNQNANSAAVRYAGLKV